MGEVPPIGGMRLVSFFRNIPHFFENFRIFQKCAGFRIFFYVVFFCAFFIAFYLFIFGTFFLRFLIFFSYF